ncbi:hypothetical protein MYX07_01010 [Patescibacteria group bacterium AH-259-L07]|nr:hypothetical protein [Patescibacteria group bacterium AH-259-L07]
MKNICCQCGRTIEIESGIAGLYVGPTPVYRCPCGYAYIPEFLGCMGLGMEHYASPDVLSPSEYKTWKEKKLKRAKELSIPADKTIKEIQAEVVE